MDIRERKRNASKAKRAREPKDAKERKGNTLDRVYGELRRAILNLELAPGSNLDESDFVSQLNVSRTPVREAYLLLANDGLVTLSRNRGAYVSSIELSKAREFFEALEVSQRIVTRWAASRRTAEDIKDINHFRVGFENAGRRSDVSAMIKANLGFHRAIALSCHNSYILDEYCYLLTLGLRFSQVSLRLPDEDSDPGHHEGMNVDAIVEEHRAMVVAITTCDAQTADRLGRDHVTLFRQRILNALSRSLDTGLEFT